LDETRDERRLQLPSRHLIEMLTQCCKDRAPAVILTLQEAKVYYHAQLACITGDALTLSLSQKLIKAPPVGATCCISFNYKKDTRAFLANVLEYRRNLDEINAELVLNLQSGIMQREARLAYRVDVTLGSRLMVKLVTKDKRSWRPRVMDLSLTGIYVDFTDDLEYPKLAIGSTLSIEMSFPPEALTLKGEVRRQVGPRYGIFFVEIVTAHGLNPPLALKKIVSSLEREWLQERIHAYETGSDWQ
jgi:hypothetical protein